MYDGSETVSRNAEAILKELTTRVRFIGKPGEAANVKALVNMVMNINTAGLAEGLALGAALGLDLNMLREVFPQTGANIPDWPNEIALSHRWRRRALLSLHLHNSSFSVRPAVGWSARLGGTLYPSGE
jgi:3-hydroxyisobutyrate dehydrogenase-like beta-hydroxyacid dehydrogenase